MAFRLLLSSAVRLWCDNTPTLPPGSAYGPHSSLLWRAQSDEAGGRIHLMPPYFANGYPIKTLVTYRRHIAC